MRIALVVEFCNTVREDNFSFIIWLNQDLSSRSEKLQWLNKAPCHNFLKRSSSTIITAVVLLITELFRLRCSYECTINRVGNQNWKIIVEDCVGYCTDAFIEQPAIYVYTNYIL